MKAKYVLLTIPVWISLLIGSCRKDSESSLFDVNPDDIPYNEQKVFSDSIQTMEFVTSIYRNLSYNYFLDNAEHSGGGYWSFADITDDAENRWSGNAQIAPMFNLNTFPSESGWSRFNNAWTMGYRNIRWCNIFLKNSGRVPISGPVKSRLAGEVKFLRAYYYLHLFRLYSGIPLVGDSVYTLTDPIKATRATFAETVNYLSKELDEAAAALPLKHQASDFGKPTKGAALALKSKLLLYAASQLFNGNNIATDPTVAPLIGYTDSDPQRWKKAADAAKAVIDLGQYSLLQGNPAITSQHGLYLATTQRVNDELIFSILPTSGRFTENRLLPPSRGGQYYSFPSHALVDAFDMSNGKPIADPQSGYSETSPFVNRDPRFYVTILYQGALWLNNNLTTSSAINFAVNSTTGDVFGTSTRTGFLFRKLCNESATGGGGLSTNAGLIVSRYAEVLLNYAEALNEFQGPGQEVYQAVEAIRQRGGLNPYTLPVSLNKDQMRAVIRNERRVELALEEAHRFFDIKRWKIAEDVNKGPLVGRRYATPASTGERVTAETRVFITPKMYNFPIPLTEVNKAGGAILQNPGW
ncbi:RagB/SusD family nutrient uptake outer membrane protein [Niabella yanshanensis]|uniref:RagB/SusD family nutrient uptake outer membrane protein n=1 Tax=Niabella yanshanensis TaxID=577386 RepID=A0ABZ0WAC3_9BACT|nr:RagB/SusD family nutrient uptake outer membrane protein [Niabella yanshanensis]WQD38492.1 RagB/SusD family nutrient uptake outer membrane protein [Niabella yanshanensis]